MSEKSHTRGRMAHLPGGDRTVLVGLPVEHGIAHTDFNAEMHALKIELAASRHKPADERLLQQGAADQLATS